MIAAIIEGNGNYASQADKDKWFRLVAHIKQGKPEKQWLLGVLKFLDPNHMVFEKGYRPEKGL